MKNTKGSATFSRNAYSDSESKHEAPWLYNLKQFPVIFTFTFDFHNILELVCVLRVHSWPQGVLVFARISQESILLSLRIRADKELSKVKCWYELIMKALLGEGKTPKRLLLYNGGRQTMNRLSFGFPHLVYSVQQHREHTK